MRDPNLGLGHPLAGGAQLRLQLGLLARARAQRLGDDRRRRPSPSIRRSSAAARSPAASRASAAASQSSSSAASDRLLALEPARERILAAAPSMSSTRRAICAARSEASRTRADLLAASAVARRPRARASSAAVALASASPIRSSPAATGSSPAFAPLALGELLGERAERGAAALDRRARARSRRAASASARTREPLVGGADGGQPAPGLGALAIARGELAPRSRCGAAFSLASSASSSSRGSRAAAAPFCGVGELRVVAGSSAASSRARSSTASRSSRAWMSAACAWRFSGRSRRAGLALDVERAVEVVLGALELQLRAAAALAVLAEPGGLLDQQPALARRREDDLLDPALADHRVHLAAEVGVGERLDHVGEPGAGAVQPVARRPRRARGAG